MTERDFKTLPWLLHAHQVLQVLDVSASTLAKMVDCGLLNPVKPPGAGQVKYRKVQVAVVLGLAAVDFNEWTAMPLILSEKLVTSVTGYSKNTVRKIAAAGGIHEVRMAGMGGGRYRKCDVAKLIGLGV